MALIDPRTSSTERAGGAATVLRRKVRARDASQGPPQMTVSKAVAQAMAKAAQTELSLGVQVRKVTEGRRALGPMIEDLPGDGLYFSLLGPEGALGFLHLDGALLAAIVQIQTIGSVIGATGVARVPTASDAALSEAVLNCFLDQMGMVLGAHPDHLWAEGFNCRGRLTGPRQIELVFPDVPYRRIDLTASILDGAVEGHLILSLPADRKRPPSAAEEQAEAEIWAAGLRHSVSTARARLQVVMHRHPTTLEKVASLEVGMVLPIPKLALTAAAIEAPTGHKITEGRLGFLNGYRAVRVMSHPQVPQEMGGAMPLEKKGPAPPPSPAPKDVSPSALPAPQAGGEAHPTDSPQPPLPEESDPPTAPPPV